VEAICQDFLFGLVPWHLIRVTRYHGLIVHLENTLRSRQSEDTSVRNNSDHSLTEFVSIGLLDGDGLVDEEGQRSRVS
jgi:hypothetical protein